MTQIFKLISFMKQAIIFRTDLKLGKGKIAAHAGHAAVSGYALVARLRPELAERWIIEGQKKIVLKVSSEKELLKIYRGAKRVMPCEIIRDMGLTQVPPGTIICCVIGPWIDEEVNKITNKLKLL